MAYFPVKTGKAGTRKKNTLDFKEARGDGLLEWQ